MSYIYLSAPVKGDGSLTIPSFAVRGLGYKPGADVNLALPTEICDADCEDSELLIKRVCDDYSGEGYTTEGGSINIPLELIRGAGIRPGSMISVLSSDGMLIIAATDDGRQSDLTDELGCFMAELGHDPEKVESIRAALPF